MYKNDNVDMEMVRTLVDDYADCGEITYDSIVEYMIDYQMYSLNEDYIGDYNDYLMRCGQNIQNTYCDMGQLDCELSDYTPSEIIDGLDRDFDINDEYFYVDEHNTICSCDSDYILEEMEGNRDFLADFIYECCLVDEFNTTYHEEIETANEILEREEEEDEDWAY